MLFVRLLFIMFYTVIMPTSTDTSASFTHGDAPLADGETMTDNNPILAYHAYD